MNDVAKLGTILGIWAHPDDESFMVGGILSMAVANGQQVACVTATKGEAGVQNESRWPAATLGQTRANELAAALEILGIQNHHWLGYQDGGCASVPDDEVVPRLVEFIEQYKPDTIITFPPDGLTGHPDHQSASRWATKAAAASTAQPQVYYAVNTQEDYDSHLKAADEQFNIYFATDNPIFVPEADCDVHVVLSTNVMQRKLAALKAMPSQTSKMFENLGDDGFAATFSSESLVRASNNSRWVGL